MGDDYMQHYGLVQLPDDEQDSSSSQPESEITATKASQKGGRGHSTKVDNEEHIKKGGKRGRPRVDPSDESAIEHRRTQIRLAQRAYRERKETTISELENQVSRLQNKMTDMSQAYFDFSNRAQASGLGQWNPALLADLNATTQRFMDLTNTITPDVEAEEEPPKRKKPRHKASASGSPEESRPKVARGKQRQTQSSESSNSQPDPGMMLGYQVYDSTPDREMDPIPDETTHQMSWPGNMELQQFNATIPQGPAFTEKWKSWVDKPITPIFTYNFQETSFWRRLIRFSYEKVYHLLMNPATPPELITNVLRYSLCLGDARQIAETIRQKLLRASSEPIEAWNVPALHVGGAGLHYSRPEKDSMNRPVQELMQNQGPFPWRPGVDGVPMKDFPYNLEKFAGVEGVWFDAFDVEQYLLKEKGIVLDGSSPIAVVEVDESVPTEVPFGSPQTESADSISLPQSPTQANDMTPGFNFAIQTSDDSMFLEFDNLDNPSLSNLNLDFTVASESNIDKSNLAHQTAATVMPLSHSLPLMASPLAKRRVVIDVDRLLQELHTGAVCLGRAPGFKLEHVDRALQTVVKEAW